VTPLLAFSGLYELLTISLLLLIVTAKRVQNARCDHVTPLLAFSGLYELLTISLLLLIVTAKRVRFRTFSDEPNLIWLRHTKMRRRNIRIGVGSPIAYLMMGAESL
jgi:hypothetical protein